MTAQEVVAGVDSPTCMACVTAVDSDALEMEIAHVKDSYMHACGLVADMHAAARGFSGGGVVEDIHDLRTERDALKDRCRALEEEVRELRHHLLSA